MSALVSSKDVEAIVRSSLRQKGYSISAERGYGETGTDIIATRGKQALHIEAISYKKPGPARSRDFYEVFFRAVSRLEHDATTLVIALPSRFGMGLPQRAKRMGQAWKRIGKAFPELQIWLVDTSAHSIKETKWNIWDES